MGCKHYTPQNHYNFHGIHQDRIFKLNTIGNWSIILCLEQYQHYTDNCLMPAKNTALAIALLTEKIVEADLQKKKEKKTRLRQACRKGQMGLVLGYASPVFVFFSVPVQSARLCFINHEPLTSRAFCLDSRPAADPSFTFKECFQRFCKSLISQNSSPACI